MKAEIGLSEKDKELEYPVKYLQIKKEKKREKEEDFFILFLYPIRDAHGIIKKKGSFLSKQDMPTESSIGDAV